MSKSNIPNKNYIISNQNGVRLKKKQFPVLGLFFYQTGRHVSVFPIPILSPPEFSTNVPPDKKGKAISKRKVQEVLQSTHDFFHENSGEFSGEYRVAWRFSSLGNVTQMAVLLPLEGFFRDDSGLVLLPLQGGLAGDTYSALRWWKISR